MPTTKEKMASNALVMLGDDPISSLEEFGAGAQAASNLYDTAYESALAEHPWTFALKEQILSRLTEEPNDLVGYQYAFQIPGDCIRIWALFPTGSNYDIVGSLIYSNETSLLARYTYKVAEEILPPHFTHAIELKLAAMFALSVTESRTKAADFNILYDDYMARAMNADSQGKPQVSIMDRPFSDVRGF